MAAGVGRNVTLTWDDGSPSLIIAGVKEKDVTLSGEPIDITSDDDAGWRTLLSVSGQNSVELKVSGVTKNKELMADWFAGNLMQTVTLTYQDGSIITGSFFLSSYSEKGPFKDAVSFDATLMSSGEITFTAGS